MDRRSRGIKSQAAALSPHPSLSSSHHQLLQQGQLEQLEQHQLQSSSVPVLHTPASFDPVQLDQLRLQQHPSSLQLYCSPLSTPACLQCTLPPPPTTVLPRTPMPRQSPHTGPPFSMVRPQIPLPEEVEDPHFYFAGDDSFGGPLSTPPIPRFYIPSHSEEGIRSVPLPGVRCPKCAKDGKEVWVIPGRACGYCGTACI